MGKQILDVCTCMERPSRFRLTLKLTGHDESNRSAIDSKHDERGSIHAPVQCVVRRSIIYKERHQLDK